MEEIIPGENQETPQEVVSVESSENVVEVEEIVVVEQSFDDKVLKKLTEKTRKFYRTKSSRSIDEWVIKFSTFNRRLRSLGCIVPFNWKKKRYLTPDEYICIFLQGEHRLFRGPGFFWITDPEDYFVGKKFKLEKNITEVGPYTIIFVKPNCMKYARREGSTTPMFLGPGLHLFEGVKILLDKTEIYIDFEGDNQLVDVDDAGIFQFIYVTVGSQALVAKPNGMGTIFGDGLYLLQKPDKLLAFNIIDETVQHQEVIESGEAPEEPSFLSRISSLTETIVPW